MSEIDNTHDMIDTRDLIERIDELESDLKDTPDDTDAAEGLATLKAFAAEIDGNCEDYLHGETLIRDSYFRRYAEELAEDCGLIPADLKWPCNCIDWTRATRELQQDYTSADFDGVTYWFRS